MRWTGDCTVSPRVGLVKAHLTEAAAVGQPVVIIFIKRTLQRSGADQGSDGCSELGLVDSEGGMVLSACTG